MIKSITLILWSIRFSYTVSHTALQKRGIADYYIFYLNMYLEWLYTWWAVAPVSR